jgi:hypothetical protein
MSSIKFVKKVINDLVKKFPSIQCTYQYDISSNTHFIEVLPNNVYHKEGEYAKAETKATLSFIDKFPHESICFITDDAIIKLDNPIYIKAGDLFSSTPLPTFAMPDLSFISELMNWKTPFNIGSWENKSLYDLITSFDVPAMPVEYWTYSPNNETPVSEPMVITDEVENELPLAA